MIDSDLKSISFLLITITRSLFSDTLFSDTCLNRDNTSAFQLVRVFDEDLRLASFKSCVYILYV